MKRSYARAPRGTRIVEQTPCGRWKTIKFIGAPRSKGLVAPPTIDGALSGLLLLAWSPQHLVPALQPCDFDVMDNLSSHKVAGVREALESVGAEVPYLSPYSSDVNPTELAFAKFKKLLRDGAARAAEDLWYLYREILDAFPENECHNYFPHCGYRYS